MKNLIARIYSILLGMMLCITFNTSSVQAMVFTQIPFEFETFAKAELTDSDADDDDDFGKTSLGFNVTIGGSTYDAFNMSSNGFVELLSGGDTATGDDYGYIADLISTDPSATYLLSAFDDLSSDYYGYYGYALESDRAVFYYDTETYDEEDDGNLNNFEMILNSDGSVQWNYNYAEYTEYSYNLFSGLYFGNTGELQELYRGVIPAEESWIYAVQNGGDEPSNAIPEPATMLLLGSGMIGAFVTRKRRS